MINNNLLILVTGSNGVLGTALKKQLTIAGLNFLAPGRQELDLLNKDLTIDYISKHQPSIVIHLAALVYGLGGNLKNQMDSVYCNTLINNNLFYALNLFAPEKIFFAGTVASYGHINNNVALQEDVFFDGLPHYGEFGYSMSKKHAYTYLKILAETKKTEFVYGIFTNLFGEHDKFDIENGHVIPSLIAKAFQAKKQNITLDVWGNGDASRDFLYAADAAAAILFLLNIEKFNNIINISSNNAVSIRTLAETVYKAANLNNGTRFLSDMPSGIMSRVVNNKRLLDLGFKLTHNFESAIQATYDWYALQQENVL